MQLQQAITSAKRYTKKHAEPTMVVYDDDYLTYRLITADTYYRYAYWMETDVVWSSDEGYIWTRHHIAKHPA